MMNYGGYGDNMFWIGSLFMFLFLALLLVGIVALIVWIVKQNQSHAREKDTEMSIVKTRYAKGELTKEEFESLKKDLSA